MWYPLHWNICADITKQDPATSHGVIVLDMACGYAEESVFFVTSTICPLKIVALNHCLLKALYCLFSTYCEQKWDLIIKHFLNAAQAPARERHTGSKFCEVEKPTTIQTEIQNTYNIDSCILLLSSTFFPPFSSASTYIDLIGRIHEGLLSVYTTVMVSNGCSNLTATQTTNPVCGCLPLRKRHRSVFQPA